MLCTSDVDTFECDANGVSGDSCVGAFFYVPVNIEDRYTLYVVEQPASGFDVNVTGVYIIVYM